MKNVASPPFLLPLCGLVLFASLIDVHAAIPPEARARGGLCVVLGGVEELSEVEELVSVGPWVVHALDANAKSVDQARIWLLERGIYGRVSVEHWEQERLPYANNLVNLLVVRAGASGVDRNEWLRVLAPGGFALVRSGEKTTRIEKPRPEGMGEWTHPWNEASGNLASSDTALGIPNTFQWISGPPFPLDARKDSAGVILSAGGRVFAITRNVPENLAAERSRPDYLVARDAFNGLPLWSRPWLGPLSRGHADAVHEAIVVTDSRVYAATDDAVTVIDAATGADLAAFPLPFTPKKLLLSDGVLVAQGAEGLVAFDEAGQRALWTVDLPEPWGTLVDGGRVFALVGSREKDGRWRHELVALDLRSGKELWREATDSEHGHRNTAVLRLHFASGGVVCLIERTLLRAVNAEDGSELWRYESKAEARGSGSMDSRQVGHFFIDGHVWVRAARGSGGRDAPEPWLALDPKTGEVRRELAAVGDKGVVNVVDKVSCQPLTATARFVLDARLATAWDLETGERGGWKFARGGCQVGLVPANGLAYTPPNACGCVEEQLRGFLALTRSDDPGLEAPLPATTERGPAYGTESPEDATESAWPAYRRDGTRGAHLPAKIPVELAERWNTPLGAASTPENDADWKLNFGQPWSPPVAAGGLVLATSPQTHQVVALDAANGEQRWRFTAGGRVTVPPTLHRGLALFGAHDGFVYALRASDGELAWRRRAAPSERRIVAYGQLESTWPVAGGVLVHEGLALVAAGRAVDAGGGIVLLALDPLSGEARWTSRIDEAYYGMCDPLVTDGASIYLMDRRIDPKTGEVTAVEGFSYGTSDRGGAKVGFPEGVRYLRGGKAGLLQTSWTRLDIGMRKAQSAWTWGGVEGEILAFNGDRSYAFLLDTGGEESGGSGRMWSSPSSRGGGALEARRSGGKEPQWRAEINAPRQVEAIFSTADAVYVAGPRDRAEPEGPGFLEVLDRRDGSVISKLDLPVAPVHDGLIAADGLVYAMLRNGRLVSLGDGRGE